MQNQPDQPAVGAPPTGKTVRIGTITNRFFKELQDNRIRNRPGKATPQASRVYSPALTWLSLVVLLLTMLRMLPEPNSISPGNVNLIRKCSF
jgi:hypothetical protein